MPEHIGIVATITPKPDKADAVRNALLDLAKKVEQKEQGCLRYKVTEEIHQDGTPAFVIIEDYVNQAAIDHHNSTDDFKALVTAVSEQDLLAKPLDIKHTKVVGGFDSR